MGVLTPIEWCDSSLSVMSGCGGCELWTPERRLCYAGRMIDGEGNRPGFAGSKGWPEAFDKPALFPSRMPQAVKWSDLTYQLRATKPWLNGYPRLIFLNDMGDTFTEDLPENWLDVVYPTAGPRSLWAQMVDSSHIWMILTKRAGRMQKAMQGKTPVPNIWLGVSVTHRSQGRARLWPLKALKEKGWTTFLSLEPLDSDMPALTPDLLPKVSDWVIAGGGSGPDQSPCPQERLQGVVDQCRAAGVPCFVKQLGGEQDKRGGEFALVGGSLYHEMPPWREWRDGQDRKPPAAPKMPLRVLQAAP